jgi:CheY-like chemotaxis protein
MSRILVVDDSEVDRRIAVGLLQRALPDHQIELAMDGRDAIERLRDEPADLVVTDMQMPECDGLELVRAIRLHHPQIPVILMTGHGSDDLAVAALEEGAASYVPKSQLRDRLAGTIEEVLAIARADRTHERLIGCLDSTEFVFQLDNDPSLIDPLIDLVQQMAAGMGLCDTNDRFRIGVALKAAIHNALYRGNLEIGPDLMISSRDAVLAGPLVELVAQRRQTPPYCERTIRVEARIRPTEAWFVVRDDGPGFNVSQMLATISGESLDPDAGRGLVLMRAFMDEVSFNARGNEVALHKKQTSSQ